ncbi:MAG: thiamine phosphate synthase [Candidatus Poribacteria bacterium]|nr:thiamine phosphate synthase [Candidatus Poribacteria bacterium]MDE0506186.1 thiamine phosphate synthase [Candidatus Poribacteria bacterium]
MKRIGVLHVITDTTVQSRFTHAQLAEMAIEGGADTVQFRQKTGTTRDLLEAAQDAQAVCTQHAVPLIVNDRADIALAVGAAGVHFGQDDLPISIGRNLFPQNSIIGASARTEEKILKAISEGADYIGFGPIRQTSSKPDAEAPKGLDALSRMCKIARCPVIAIGGITVEDVFNVIRAGAHGVAVISAVCGAPDPLAATRHLVAEIRRAKKESEKV